MLALAAGSAHQIFSRLRSKSAELAGPVGNVPVNQAGHLACLGTEGAAVGGFRKFLFRGNLIDLAVAVVVGVAFNAVVQALIKDLITPLIAAIFGKPNFGSLAFTVHKSTFLYGDFVNALLSFVIIAAVIYYIMVFPAARFTTLATRNKAATERDCPECLSSIPIGAKKCMYCTSEVPPVPKPRQPTTDPGIGRMRHGAP
jgi:large conductance mechanosensitive channel